MEQLSGLVERVTFHNEENGFCVLQVKAAGHRELIPVTGHAPIINPGEFLTAEGIWLTDRAYGKQFKSDRLQISLPASTDGIERYLGSGMVKGIGPGYAKKLVAAFGANVFAVIEQEPERLLTVSGIGKGRMLKITSGWESQKVVKEIMVFLHEHGVPTARAVRIYKTYGDKAIATVRENPYRLAHDIRGIGFLSADNIAKHLGWGVESPERIGAGIGHALWEASGDGHCGLPRPTLISQAQELLNVEPSLIEAGVDRELAEKRLIADTADAVTVLYLPLLYHTECGIAANLERLSVAPRTLPAFDAAALYERIKGSLEHPLSENQVDALMMATQNTVMVLTGGPGVGKTSLEEAIINVFAAAGASIMLAAPTGRAAQRMSEATGREASTIHRLLGFRPGGATKYNETNPLPCDFLVVDEASMIDVFLIHTLLKAIASGTVVLIVGDEDQLESVGPGNVLGDIMASGMIAVARLLKIFRQAAGSQIIQGAHAINHGGMPTFSTKAEPGDFYFIERDDHDVVVAEILDLVKNRLPAKLGLDPVRDIQVISPMNNGAHGVRLLNERLQATLNPDATVCIERFGTKFHVRDKVMQTANDYDKMVYNGDIGYITAITDEEVLIDFSGRRVSYELGELDQVMLAYAATVHRLQGSQAPAVVMALTTKHYAMLQRKLIYTGVTRGQKMVVIVGQKKALAMAVENAKQTRRQTRLRRAIVLQFQDI